MVKDEKRREEFIEQNLGLVHTVCKRFAGKGIEYDDLYQSGCMGLVKAYDAFEEERGLCFSTYAVPVIMGSVRRLFRDGGAVKVSRSVKELGMKIAREKTKFQQSNGFEPTVSQLAEILGVEGEDITEALCAAQPTVSLTFESEEGIKETDLPTANPEDEINERLLVHNALKELDDRERLIIRYRYFCHYTQSKTAKVIGMTQVQVSRAERKILLKLRQLID
ncbi:MAG: sigma-70 family RNA polymerase sigma factor [Clostridia bacterium]|nr:sigma-70 family RNA polymerase sigma factor [Clostridia bacterium]